MLGPGFTSPLDSHAGGGKASAGRFQPSNTSRWKSERLNSMPSEKGWSPGCNANSFGDGSLVQGGNLRPLSMLAFSTKICSDLGRALEDAVSLNSLAAIKAALPLASLSPGRCSGGLQSLFVLIFSASWRSWVTRLDSCDLSIGLSASFRARIEVSAALMAFSKASPRLLDRTSLRDSSSASCRSE